MARKKPVIKKKQAAPPEVSEAPKTLSEEDAYKASLLRDYKKFYKEIIARDQIEPGLGRQADCWGRIHDIVVDFELLGETDVVTYSELPSLLPRPGVERWIYWRTLNEKPEICDGAENTISERYYEHPWQGLIIRLKGDLSKRCTLLPRGCLKSTLLSRNLLLWMMIRNPAARNLLRTIAMPLTRTFISDIRFQFEQNTKFQTYFGHLMPTKKWGSMLGSKWTQEELQLSVEGQKSGADFTLTGTGMDTDVTGKHPDNIHLDDVASESNTKTPALTAHAKEDIRKMFALMNAGTKLRDRGTIWAENDPHSLFTAPDVDASFVTATIIDADPAGKCTVEGISEEGKPPIPGNPIWPEGFSPERVHTKYVELIKNKFMWRSQYFNQLHGTVRRLFEKSWVKNRYIMTPSEVAIKERLNVCVGIRVDAGVLADEGAAAVCVVGQSPDNKKFYLLDALKGFFDPRELVQAVVHICSRWNRITDQYQGLFYAGMEKTAYEDFFEKIFQRELRRRNFEESFLIDTLTLNENSIRDAISVLQAPYRDGAYQWPIGILRNVGDHAVDMVVELMSEFSVYPGCLHHELMSAHAMAHNLTQVPDYLDKASEIREREDANRFAESMKKRDSVYATRDIGYVPSLGAFATDQEWEHGV